MIIVPIMYSINVVLDAWLAYHEHSYLWTIAAVIWLAGALVTLHTWNLQRKWR